MNTGHILIIASTAVFIAAMFEPARDVAAFHAVLAFACGAWGAWLGDRADKFRTFMLGHQQWQGRRDGGPPTL